MDEDFRDDLVIIEKDASSEDQSLLATMSDVSAKATPLPQSFDNNEQAGNNAAKDTKMHSKAGENQVPSLMNPHLQSRPSASSAAPEALTLPQVRNATPGQPSPMPDNGGASMPAPPPPPPPPPPAQKCLHCKMGCCIGPGYGHWPPPPPPPPPLGLSTMTSGVQPHSTRALAFRPAQTIPPPPPPPLPTFPSPTKKKVSPYVGIDSNPRRARSRSRSQSSGRSRSSSSRPYYSRSRSPSPESRRTLDVYNAGALVKCFHGATDRTIKLQPYEQRAYVVKANFTKTDLKKWFPLLKYTNEERWYTLPSLDIISALEVKNYGSDCDEDCNFPCCTGVLHPVQSPTFSSCDAPQIHIGAALDDLTADRQPSCACKRPSWRWNESGLQVCRCVLDRTTALKKKDITWYTVISLPQGRIRQYGDPPEPSTLGKCSHCRDGRRMVRSPTEGERLFQVVKSGSRSDAAAKAFYEAAVNGASIMFTCAVAGDVANWDVDELTSEDGPKMVDGFWEFAKVSDDALYFGRGWTSLTSPDADW